MQIIRQSKGQKFSADEIMQILKDEGKQINEQSLYSNIRKLEKEGTIKSRLFIRHKRGSGHKFYKKVWSVMQDAINSQIG